MAHEVVKVTFHFAGFFLLLFRSVECTYIHRLSVVDIAFVIVWCILLYFVKPLGWFSPLLFLPRLETEVS